MDPQSPHLKNQAPWHTLMTPVLDKSRDRRGLLAGQPNLTGKFQARGRPFLQRNKLNGVGRPQLKVLHWPPCVTWLLTHACSPTHKHAHAKYLSQN